MKKFTVSLMAAVLFGSLGACAVEAGGEGEDPEAAFTEELRSMDPNAPVAEPEPPADPEATSTIARQQDPERSRRWQICPVFFPFCLECWGIPSEPQTHQCTIVAPPAKAQ